MQCQRTALIFVSCSACFSITFIRRISTSIKTNRNFTLLHRRDLLLACNIPQFSLQGSSGFGFAKLRKSFPFQISLISYFVLFSFFIRGNLIGFFLPTLKRRIYMKQTFRTVSWKKKGWHYCVSLILFIVLSSYFYGVIWGPRVSARLKLGPQF